MLHCHQISMEKLVSILFAASILLSGFCPLTLAAAMQPSQPMEHVSQSEEVLMSPYMPMTLIAPMSVASVVIQYESSLMTQTLGGCSGVNCIRMDRVQKQEIAISVTNGDRQGAALPASAPSIADVLSMPTSPPVHTGDSHLANTIATIVLRV